MPFPSRPSMQEHDAGMVSPACSPPASPPPAPDPRVVSRRHALGTAVAGASSTRSGNPATSPPRGPRALAIAFVAAADAFARIFAHPPPAAGTRPLMIVRAASPVDADALGSTATLRVALPPGYHLTRGANSRFEVVVAEGHVQVSPSSGKLEDGKDVVLRIEASKKTPSDGAAPGEVLADATVYFCREDDVCLLQRARFEIPLQPGGAREAMLRLDVQPPVTETIPANLATIPGFDE